MSKRRRTYKGEPFPKTAYARMNDSSDGPTAEYWDEDGPGGMLSMDEPEWVATYRLVSVRRLKRTVKVVRA